MILVFEMVGDKTEKVYLNIDNIVEVRDVKEISVNETIEHGRIYFAKGHRTFMDVTNTAAELSRMIFQQHRKRVTGI